VEDWAAEQSELALCPISEGAIVRYLVRMGVPAALVRRSMAAVYSHHGWTFLPDSVSYSQADLDAVTGHRQVTDAYLVALAAANKAVLATLDQALAAMYPESSHLVAAGAS
jgi:predicted nucleic acid-binding protein